MYADPVHSGAEEQQMLSSGFVIIMLSLLVCLL